MARNIDEIRKEIINYKNNEPELAALNNTSSTAIWRLWINVFATAAWTLENLFDEFVLLVKDIISKQKPHTLRWYRDKALRFQAGRALFTDSDYYNNKGLSNEQVKALEIVKQAAAVEQKNNSSNQRIVRIKIAGGIGKLKPLPENQIEEVKNYFMQIKDAGVLLDVTSNQPDNLFGRLKVHYNPLVLTESGLPTNGGNVHPVREAINKYLQTLTFNGEFSIMKMIDAVQNVEGVELVHANDIKIAKNGGTPENISDRHTPDSGYMRVDKDDDLIIEYKPYIDEHK